jgi:hypothetical protein
MDMMNGNIDLQHRDISSKSFKIPTPKSFIFHQTSFRFESDSDGSIEALRKILSKGGSTGQGAC